MKHAIMRALCRLLVVATVLLPFSAHAGMIGTGQAVAGAASDRAALLGRLARSDVAAKLSALGVDPSAAAARVQAMTDAEVATLAGEVRASPAGGTSFGFALILFAIVGIVLVYRYR